MKKVINENSTAYLSLTFKNKDGEIESPQAVTYNIHCLTNDVEIKGDTSVSPGPSIEIVLSPTENRIIDANNKYERRVVTVTATYGPDDEITGQYEYKVLNLKYIS